MARRVNGDDAAKPVAAEDQTDALTEEEEAEEEEPTEAESLTELALVRHERLAELEPHIRIEIVAVVADLQAIGGVARYEDYIKEYVDEAYNETNWPATWEEFMWDLAWWIVFVRESAPDISEGATLGGDDADAGTEE